MSRLTAAAAAAAAHNHFTLFRTRHKFTVYFLDITDILPASSGWMTPLPRNAPRPTRKAREQPHLVAVF